MKTGNCFLDTNIVIHLLNGNTSIAERLDSFSVVYIPSIVVGELFYGAYNSQAQFKNKQRIVDFLIRCTILQIGETTADIYGKIKADLKKMGKMIPENDIWIAAVVIEHHGILATNDNHFNEIENLISENW